MVTVIAYVPSTKDQQQQYTILDRDGRLQCNCKAFFLSETQKNCKHINRLLSIKNVKKGAMTLSTIKLTKKGRDLLAHHRERLGIPTQP
jgi:hypothetical protein